MGDHEKQALTHVKPDWGVSEIQLFEPESGWLKGCCLNDQGQATAA